MFVKRIDNSVKGAVELLLSDYKKQRETIKYLPPTEIFRKSLSQKTDELFSKGSGFTFYEDNQLLGFIVGYKVRKYFGSADGVYVPIHGHCISPDIKNRHIMYQKMYAHAAQKWVEEGLLSHVITLYATDRELVDTWFNLGFGNRCVDAVRQPSRLNSINKEIVVKMADRDDLDQIEKLYQTDQLYFNATPLFMPSGLPDPIEALKEWLDEQNRYLWVAFLDDKPVGFMKIEDNGENYITEHSSMMNITGAFVDETCRGRNIGATLLDTVQRFLNEYNYKLCGVDFESFNISGNAFWNKYFTPYTYSLARRIDENILKYHYKK